MESPVTDFSPWILFSSSFALFAPLGVVLTPLKKATTTSVFLQISPSVVTCADAVKVNTDERNRPILKDEMYRIILFTGISFWNRPGSTIQGSGKGEIR